MNWSAEAGLPDATECLDELARALPETSPEPADVFELLDRHGFGDGLPVGAIDSSIVEAFISAGGQPRDRVVASVRPLRGQLTTTRLAACAALSGCRPEYMPLLIAMCSALDAPEANALGVLSTTSSAAYMVVVNGPARARLGFNSGSNCLGPGSRANATVGRCLSLVTRIVGGAREGMADMATMGQPAKYGFCFAENEEASPWAPLHVDAGIAPDRSAVTLIGIGGVIEAFESDSYEPDAMVAALAPVLAHSSPIASLGRQGVAGGGTQVVLISPEWADAFARGGLGKRELQLALLRGARRANPELAIATEPEDVVVIVAGGPGVKQNVVPGWAGGSSPVTREF